MTFQELNQINIAQESNPEVLRQIIDFSTDRAYFYALCVYLKNGAVNPQEINTIADLQKVKTLLQALPSHEVTEQSIKKMLSNRPLN